MNGMIEQMLQVYDAKTVYDQKNALKEVLQEIVLCGLSRSGFFSQAAFYGGTALRIFYGLDRFSEDLDFSLTATDESFKLEEYFPMLEREVASYGLNMEIGEKEKSKESNVQSAFLKGNTKEHLLMFYENDKDFASIHKNEVIKIKFEVDTNPPAFATFERKYSLNPVPYEVQMYDEASLFAGKLHAVLGRAWKSRVKGRDLYDYVFYLTRKVPVNLKHLKARLVQSGHLADNDDFNLEILKQMMRARFAEIDFEQAKSDVLPFIRDVSVINLWSKEFFSQITEGLCEKN